MTPVNGPCGHLGLEQRHGVVVGVAGVDDQRQAGGAGGADVGAEARAPAGRAARGRRNSRGRSRRWRPPAGARASSTSGPGSSRPSLPASCGWTPTAQKTSGRRSARAMPTGQPPRLAAMWTMMLDAGRLGTRDHPGLVLGQARVVEVAMAVDDHAASGSTWRGNTPAGAGSAVPARRAPSGRARRSARVRLGHRQQVEQLGRGIAA